MFKLLQLQKCISEMRRKVSHDKTFPFKALQTLFFFYFNKASVLRSDTSSVEDFLEVFVFIF